MEEDLAALAASYRDYGGGYKIDCYSALGLLGLLGLLEILRDLVDDITMMKKKRSVANFGYFGFPREILGSLRNQIPEDILQSFPGVVMPLLHVAADVNDGLLPPECMELSFCKSNRVLLQPQEPPDSFSDRINAEGIFSLKSRARWKVAQFLSEVLAKAFFNLDFNGDYPEYDSSSRKKPSQDLYVRAVTAAAAGRNGTDCRKTFASCRMDHRFHPQPNFIHQIYA